MNEADKAILRAAVAAMPHTNPGVADDLIGGFTMHTEADDILAIWRAALAAQPGAVGLPMWKVQKQDDLGVILNERGERITTSYGAEARAVVKAHNDSITMLAAAPTEAKPAQDAVDAERSPFEQAMRETWQMVNPIQPHGQPGSYARGEYNGIIAALKTVRENFVRAAISAKKGQP